MKITKLLPGVCGNLDISIQLSRRINKIKQFSVLRLLHYSLSWDIGHIQVSSKKETSIF